MKFHNKFSMQSTELDEKYFLARAQNRVMKNDYKRAINDFTRAHRLNPENDEIYLLRAKAYSSRRSSN